MSCYQIISEKPFSEREQVNYDWEEMNVITFFLQNDLQNAIK